MSLFKARDWWATTAGDEEEYDLGCLCVANVDNSSSGFGKIKAQKTSFMIIGLWKENVINNDV